MMKKKLAILMVLMLVATLVLGACKPADKSEGAQGV